MLSKSFDKVLLALAVKGRQYRLLNSRYLLTLINSC